MRQSEPSSSPSYEPSSPLVGHVRRAQSPDRPVARHDDVFVYDSNLQVDTIPIPPSSRSSPFSLSSSPSPSPRSASPSSRRSSPPPASSLSPPTGPLSLRAPRTSSPRRRWSSSTSPTLVLFDPPPADPGQRLLRMAEKDQLPYYHTSHPSSYTVGLSRPHSRPLIDLVTNEWRNHPKYADDLLATDTAADDDDSFFDFSEKGFFETVRHSSMRLSRRIPRRIQRAILIYGILLALLWIGWKDFVKPDWELRSAMDTSLSKADDQVFGTNMRPAFNDMIQVKELDEQFLPEAHDGKRLVVVGDVHGCKEDLVRLLGKISFVASKDHLVLLGDMINKGPDSPGVLDLARDIGASCVRGNHEDKVLLARADMDTHHHAYSPAFDIDKEVVSHGDGKSRTLAKEFSKTQIHWLQQCPVILKVGFLKGLGDVVAVHAGIVPGVPLARQDPFLSMNMRTIDLDTKVPSESRDGVPWYKLWNRHETRLHKKFTHSTVLYGHDSRRGLQINKYTKGLDSGCVNGGRLSALVIRAGKKNKDEVRQEIVSVKCKNYGVSQQEKKS